MRIQRKQRCAGVATHMSDCFHAVSMMKSIHAQRRQQLRRVVNRQPRDGYNILHSGHSDISESLLAQGRIALCITQM